MSQDFVDSDYVSCPNGGDWARCADVNYPTFIGCCDSNPCGGQMCPEESHFAMGFGNITEPVPDYPNHSCPYGGLWYTCSSNTVPFQGCCASNPCNGNGCPAGDLMQAALATVEVAGGSTYTVPPTVTLPTSTAAPSETPGGSESGGSNVAAIAGGAAGGGVVLIAFIFFVVWYCMRKKRKERAALEKAGGVYPGANGKGFYYDSPGNVMTPLPNYPGSVSPHPHSSFEPMPYNSKPRPEEPPQEIMGLGLTREEFTRKHHSREPSSTGSAAAPVELPSDFPPTRTSAFREAESPLLDSQSQTISSVRSSQLRYSNAPHLAGESTLSPGSSPRLR